MLTLGFLLALGSLAVVGTSAYIRIGTLVRDRAPVDQSHRVLGDLVRLGDSLNGMDRAERSYVGTGAEPYRQAFLDSSGHVSGVLRDLGRETADDPAHGRTYAILKPDVQAKQA